METEMETYTQFSIFLPNKPGVLSQIFRELARSKLNVTSIAMMDSMEHGVLRLITDDPGGTRPALKQLNVSVSEAEVLGVTLPNRPGAAADLCEKLAHAHINIGYMYCTGPTKGGKTLVILRVPDIRKASKVLENSKSSSRDMKVKLRRPATAKRR